MTRVLHTGDTHVGYQQYHDPRRRRDFLEAFEAVIEDAIADDVDAVVHAGDLFHDRRPDLQDLQGVVAALRELRAAEIPFLAIVGNHEAKRSGQWLDLFADLDLAERLDDEPRYVGEDGAGDDDLALYGLDHVPESERDDLDYEFADHDAERSALVAHGLFGPFDPAEWDTEHVLEAATVDFDAMLLGDNHIPGKQRVEDTWVTYPGSTERASASERADRGYNLVTVEDGDLRITRRTIETREFVFVDVELEAGEGADVVRDRVREYDHEDAVTVVTVEGEGEPIAPGPIEELASEQGALVARVNDRRDREDADDETLDVSFADPDEAVRRRVREMGLSTAARDLDRVIRDGSIADSNVRESARRRVEERRESGLEAFEPVPEDEVELEADPDSEAARSDDPGSAADESVTEESASHGSPEVEETVSDPADASPSLESETPKESRPQPASGPRPESDGPGEADPTPAGASDGDADGSVDDLAAHDASPGDDESSADDGALDPVESAEEDGEPDHAQSDDGQPDDAQSDDGQSDDAQSDDEPPDEDDGQVSMEDFL